MKNIVIVLAVLVTTVAGRASAQNAPDFGPFANVMAALAVIGMAEDAVIGGGGLVVGTAAGIQVARGANAKPWWIASLGLAGANLAAGAVWMYIAGNNFWDRGFFAVAAAHAGVAVFDLVMATVGITHPPPVEPTVVAGVGASGKPFTGLGVRLATF